MRIGKRAAIVTVGAAAVLATAGGIAVAAGDDTESDDLSRPGTVSVDESTLPEDDAVEREALIELATVDETAATAAAVESVGGGETVGAELDDEDGFVVWEVEVRGADGSLQEITVDAGDASVLGSEAEDDEQDDEQDDDATDGAEGESADSDD